MSSDPTSSGGFVLPALSRFIAAYHHSSISPLQHISSARIPFGRVHAHDF
jgi:hypothetical protein